jgi:hypothetical protein
MFRVRWVLLSLGAGSFVAAGNCGGGLSGQNGDAGMSTGSGGSSGHGASDGSAAGTGGSMSTGSGGSMASGSGGSGSSGGTGGQGQTGQGGTAGLPMTCTPGLQGAFVADCGYPMQGAGALAAVTFSENEVLRAIQPEGGAPSGTVRLFYNDEHALTLGVRSVVVKTAGGSMTTDYPVSPLMSVPGSVMNAQFGTTELAGDQSGLDQSLRPMWPALYITDITNDSNSRAGDWQHGGRPTGPTAVFGTWKAAVRTVDKTVTPATVTIAPDSDPTKNHWSLGSGADTPPAGLTDQGYGAEARWTVPLGNGHSYRVQVLVHDGDQNKAGGDSGEACVLFCAGGSGAGDGGTGGAGGNPPPMCPQGIMACGAGGIDPVNCPPGTVCANGCCLNLIP